MTATNLTPNTVDTPTPSEILEILHALRQPACYPHHPDRVEMVQTHISAVFLAGDEVYKLKKPVRFSFWIIRRSLCGNSTATKKCA